jgi:hypothetical protein
MITVAIGTARRSVRRLKPKGRNTDTQHQRGSLFDAEIALREALLQANLQIWPHGWQNTNGAAWSGVMAHRCLK